MKSLESDGDAPLQALTPRDIVHIEYLMKNKDWDGWPKTQSDIDLLRTLRKIPVNELYPIILCSVPGKYRHQVLCALVDRNY